MATIISLTELKERLQLTGTTYDTFLNSLLIGVTSVFEDYCGRSFTATTTITEKFDIQEDQRVIRLSYIPVVSIISVVDVGTTLVPDDYYEYLDIGIIKTRTDSCFTKGLQAVTVTYEHGYITPPVAVKEAALAICVDWYRRQGREGVSSERIGDYAVTFRDALYSKYSTEWNFVRDILERFKKDVV